MSCLLCTFINVTNLLSSACSIYHAASPQAPCFGWSTVTCPLQDPALWQRLRLSAAAVAAGMSIIGSGCCIQSDWLSIPNQVPAVAAALAVIYGVWSFLKARQRVFLLDFSCYKPPENLKVGLNDFMKGSRDSGVRSQLPPLHWPPSRPSDPHPMCAPLTEGAFCNLPSSALA
jgi:hypothetical protein